MRLDEMIIKANADGKTYVNEVYNEEYSANKGFVCEAELLNSLTSSTYIFGWKEKPKRHLTLSEAEKELDCEIDTPDISKLFRPMSEKPDDIRNVIIVSHDNYVYNGYYSERNKWIKPTGELIYSLFHWIDPADLIKLLPKE